MNTSTVEQKQSQLACDGDSKRETNSTELNYWEWISISQINIYVYDQFLNSPKTNLQAAALLYRAKV